MLVTFDYLPEVVLALAFGVFVAATIQYSRDESENTFPRSMVAGVGGHYGNGLA